MGVFTVGGWWERPTGVCVCMCVCVYVYAYVWVYLCVSVYGGYGIGAAACWPALSGRDLGNEKRAERLVFFFVMGTGVLK